MPTASCHCGNVRISVPAMPSYGNSCQCSICRRYGVIWGYWHPDEVRIESAAAGSSSYAWGERTISFGRCARCGVVTDWQATREEDRDRMGVNLRLFDAEDLRPVPIRESRGPD